MHNSPTMAALIDPYSLRFPPHSAVVERILGDTGPMDTADKFPPPSLERARRPRINGSRFTDG